MVRRSHHQKVVAAFTTKIFLVMSLLKVMLSIIHDVILWFAKNAHQVRTICGRHRNQVVVWLSNVAIMQHLWRRFIWGLHIHDDVWNVCRVSHWQVVKSFGPFEFQASLKLMWSTLVVAMYVDGNQRNLLPPFQNKSYVLENPWV